MNLQISPGGIILALPLYWLAFLGMRRAWRRVGGNPKYWFLPYLAPIVLILPFADEFWIAWNFERVCEEAGVKVFRRVDVEGFYDDTLPSGFELIERYGYRRMEHRASDGKTIEQVEKVDGKWRRTILDRPQARYHYRYADPRQWVPVGYQINRLERQVVDAETTEVLGRQVKYERYPGFIEGLWIRFLGSGQEICPDPEKGPHQPSFPEAVLIPKKAI